MAYIYAVSWYLGGKAFLGMARPTRELATARLGGNAALAMADARIFWILLLLCSCCLLARGELGVICPRENTLAEWPRLAGLGWALLGTRPSRWSDCESARW